LEGISKGGYTTIYMLKEDDSAMIDTEIAELKQYLVENFYEIDELEGYFNITPPIFKRIDFNIELEPQISTQSLKSAVYQRINILQADSNICWFRKDIRKVDILRAIEDTTDGERLVGQNYKITSGLDQDVYTLAYNEYPIISINVEG
jgi:hypothetical protein